MHSREYVEDMVIASLCKPKEGDLPDALVEPDFKKLIPVFDVVMAKVLRKTSIPSFSEEDLISFMYLKAHQILRQEKWDRSRNPYSFFYVSFTFLMRDIVRRQQSNKVQALRWDVLDVILWYSYDERRDQEYELA